MTTETADLRDALAAELERLRQTDVGRRMTAIEVLLAENGTMPVPGLERQMAPTPTAPGRRGPGVSQAKLKAVAQYLQAHGTARQATIAEDLEENSGSVSLALRALEAEGAAEDTGMIDNKSKVWRYTGLTTEPERTTVIDVNDGVIREGRRR